MTDHFESFHKNHHTSGLARPIWPGLTLLLIALLGAAAFGRLVPKVSEGTPGTTARLGWYFHSGQWQADVRTLAAAFQYLMSPDQNIKSWFHSPTNQLATAVSEPGTNSPSTNDLPSQWRPTRS